MAFFSGLLLLVISIAVVFGQNPRYEIVEFGNYYTPPTNEDRPFECNSDIIQSCSRNYLQMLKVKIDENLQEIPANFGRRLTVIELVFGREGFAKICTANSDLVKCIGEKDTFDRCFHVKSFPSWSITNAVGFVEIFRKKSYECSNMEIITARGTWECLSMTALDEGQGQIDQCHRNFQKNIQEELSRICSHVIEYKNCMEEVFAGNCGWNIGPHICRIVKIGIDLRLPQCQIDCAEPPDVYYPFIRPHIISHQFATERHLARKYSTMSTIDGNEACNAELLKECALKAGETLGIQMNRFDNALRDLKKLVHSKEGFLTVCRIGKEFDNCAQSSLKACMNSKMLVNIGIPFQTAVAITSGYTTYEFECAHQEVFGEKFYCIQTVTREKRHQLTVCKDQFLHVLSQNPHQYVVCKALQTVTDCMRVFYGNECGLKVGETICEMIHSSLKKLDFGYFGSCVSYCMTIHSSLTFRFVPHEIALEQQAWHKDQEMLVKDKKLRDSYESEEMLENENEQLSDFFFVGDLQNGCNVEKLRRCSVVFNKTLKIDANESWLNSLHEIIGIQRKQGFLKICSAISQFDVCLDENLNKCTATETMVNVFGMDKVKAREINVTFFSLKYECAHQEFRDNFDCLMKIKVQRSDTIRRCRNRYLMESEPYRASQALMYCISALFKRNCGNELGLAICQFYKTLFETYKPIVKKLGLQCD